MDLTGVQPWAAPAATIAAAIVAGTFARLAASGRISRLKASIELRDRIDSSQRDDWDAMIAHDAHAVMRQASSPPVMSWVTLWLGAVTHVVGTTTANSPTLQLAGLALVSAGGLWVLGWQVRRGLDLLAIRRQLKAETSRLKKATAQSELKAAQSEEKLAVMREQLRLRRKYSYDLLMASGAPRRLVSKTYAQLVDDIDNDRTPRDPTVALEHLDRPTWKLRRKWRARKRTRRERAA